MSRPKFKRGEVVYSLCYHQYAKVLSVQHDTAGAIVYSIRLCSPHLRFSASDRFVANKELRTLTKVESRR